MWHFAADMCWSFSRKWYVFIFFSIFHNYLHRRLASGGVVTFGVTLCVCPPSRLYHVSTARRISFGGEGNALYPVLYSFCFFFFVSAAVSSWRIEYFQRVTWSEFLYFLRRVKSAVVEQRVARSLRAECATVTMDVRAILCKHSFLVGVCVWCQRHQATHVAARAWHDREQRRTATGLLKSVVFRPRKQESLWSILLAKLKFWGNRLAGCCP